jgi:hypothetical protein
MGSATGSLYETERVKQIIADFKRDRPSLSPQLRSYADAAATGCVL